MLTARERRALRDIEHRLRSEDPALADQLEFGWWRRRVFANRWSWAWIGAAVVLLIVGLLASGLVIAAGACFAFAVLALDRFAAAMISAPKAKEEP